MVLSALAVENRRNPVALLAEQAESPRRDNGRTEYRITTPKQELPSLPRLILFLSPHCGRRSQQLGTDVLQHPNAL
jgi:hypothetical protein